ncbi:MAG: mechanosensitive ion channel family protein [Alphaproteobacteria bacterium]|nr:mechanosensitive ion channel family protein [Alphaproteobacteria bacterium]
MEKFDLSQSITNFKELVIDVWEKGVFDITIGNIVVAVIILIFFIAIRHMFARFVLNRIKGITKRTKSKIDDEIIDALGAPVSIIPIILGLFFASEYVGLKGSLLIVETKIVRSLLAIVIFWSLINISSPIATFANKIGKGKILTESMVEWLLKIAKAAFLFVAIAAVLEIWGVKVGPILAGFGLFGVAVALGAQEMFKNLIAGFLIVAEKKFKKGERIIVDGVVDGVVENIGFRSTSVRKFDKSLVSIPNTKLSDNAVVNASKIPFRRIIWTIGLEYGSSAKQLREVKEKIQDFIDNSGKFAPADKATAAVFVDAFNDSSIDLKILCFAKTKEWDEWMQTKEDFIFRIKEIVEDEAKTGFAFPSQSIYVSKD